MFIIFEIDILPQSQNTIQCNDFKMQDARSLQDVIEMSPLNVKSNTNSESPPKNATLYDNKYTGLANLYQKIFLGKDSDSDISANISIFMKKANELGDNCNNKSSCRRSNYFSMYGFSSLSKIQFISKALTRIVKPRLLFVSMIDDNRWEGLMICDGRIALTEEGRLTSEHTQTALESFLDLMRSSVTVDEIDYYMSPTMLTFITRLVDGKNYMGNWLNYKNLKMRRDYQFKMSERRRVELQAWVVSETGLSFSEKNMVSLGRSAANAQVDLVQARVRLRQVVDDLHHVENAPLQTPQAIQNVIQTLRRELQNFPGVIQLAPPPPRDSVGPHNIVDLTNDSNSTPSNFTRRIFPARLGSPVYTTSSPVPSHVSSAYFEASSIALEHARSVGFHRE